MKLALTNRVPVKWSRDVMMDILGLIERQVNALAEGRIQARHFSGTSAPTTGSFARGDIIWNSTPSAGGTIGWVCVTAGSPGTWKTWGAISA